ncbi:FmdB family zinc ribbon protein [Stieleria varia]|uniref:Zinc ribbon domain protein n=1 Tax=Stieleria varia TaxID=2528005 RepID=A0A5C6AWB6_9BACT|nr:Zinc ribbon domain protein [Stieleria varia]
MPLYLYECNSCSCFHEVLRKMDERDQAFFCEQCGATCERVMTCANLNSKTSECKASTQYRDGTSEIESQINNNTMTNGRVGISVSKGTKVSLSGNRFENIQIPIEFRDD